MLADVSPTSVFNLNPPRPLLREKFIATWTYRLESASTVLMQDGSAKHRARKPFLNGSRCSCSAGSTKEAAV